MKKKRLIIILTLIVMAIISVLVYLKEHSIVRPFLNLFAHLNIFLNH